MVHMRTRMATGRATSPLWRSQAGTSVSLLHSLHPTKPSVIPPHGDNYSREGNSYPLSCAAEDSAEERAHNRRQWESQEAERRRSQEQQQQRRTSNNAHSYAYYSTSSYVRWLPLPTIYWC